MDAGCTRARVIQGEAGILVGSFRIPAVAISAGPEREVLDLLDNF